jgi:hypothetical protein
MPTACAEPDHTAAGGCTLAAPGTDKPLCRRLNGSADPVWRLHLLVAAGRQTDRSAERAGQAAHEPDLARPGAIGSRA